MGGQQTVKGGVIENMSNTLPNEPLEPTRKLAAPLAKGMKQ